MRQLTRTACLAAVVALTGCGGAAKVTPVEGVVKLRGKPAGNLLIQFTPAGNASGAALASASAVSDGSGRFVLKSDSGRDGAPPGKYKVLVIDNELSQEGEHQPGAKVKRSRVPHEYSSATRTPLEVVVTADRKEYEVLIPPR